MALMARDCGDDPFVWIALVEAERARTTDDRRTWAELAKRLGAAAAVAAVALIPSAATLLSACNSGGLYIMSLARMRGSAHGWPYGRAVA